MVGVRYQLTHHVCNCITAYLFSMEGDMDILSMFG